MSNDKKDHGIIDTFIHYESAIKRFLGRILYRPEDVDEIAQETFLKAYSAKHKSDILSPKAYLFRVAKNIALRELTRKSVKMTDYLEDAIASDEGVMGGVDSLEDEVIAQQKVSSYCGAIVSMPPQCRKVFLLRKVHAKSHKEIAESLQITVSAVEKHIATGVKKFDAYMQAEERHNQQALMATKGASPNPAADAEPLKRPTTRALL